MAIEMVTFYGDESGTHDETGAQPGSEVSVVAGFLGRTAHWEAFTEKWIEVLEEYHVPALHMSEFVDEKRGPNKPDWPYKGWDRGRRDRFIRELVRVARDYTLVGLCGSVIVRDYDDVVPEYLKRETEHPYHFSLQSVFDNVLQTFESTLPLMLLPSEQVSFSFEQQDQFEKKAIEVFNLVKKRDLFNRLGSIGFVPKGKCRGHETADLFAYRMRKAITRKSNGQVPFSPGSWDEELNARNSLVVAYVDRQGLLDMVKALERDKQRS
jgi:hypothetical protein